MFFYFPIELFYMCQPSELAVDVLAELCHVKLWSLIEENLVIADKDHSMLFPLLLKALHFRLEHLHLRKYPVLKLVEFSSNRVLFLLCCKRLNCDRLSFCFNKGSLSSYLHFVTSEARFEQSEASRVLIVLCLKAFNNSIWILFKLEELNVLVDLLL